MTRPDRLPPLSQGLTLLLEAWDCAHELGRPTWDLAVEIGALRDAGLSNSALRWLVCKGIAEHAAEVRSHRGGRKFRRLGQLALTAATCFVLTPSGEALARGADGKGVPAGPPEWDGSRNELRWAGRVVKQFRVPSPNQVLVLAAFEEEHWPPRIDDPLPPRSGIDPRRRLLDTIYHLNHHQARPLVRFLGDGRGQGVRWELTPAAQPSGDLR